MATGVYIIKCLANNMRYVGSSARSIENRWSHHIARLSNKKTPMGEDWREHGQSNFSFSIVKVCGSKPECLEEEQRLIDYWSSRKLCYNLHPSSRSAEGYRHTEEVKKEMAEKASARCTPEWRAAVSARVKDQHRSGKFGQTTWSEEARKTVAVKTGDRLRGKPGGRLGKKATPEQVEHYRKSALLREERRRNGSLQPYIGERHWAFGKPGAMKGRKWTEAQRTNMKTAALLREAKKKEN